MHTHASQSTENKQTETVRTTAQPKTDGELVPVDNRPEAVAQLRMQEAADNSDQARQTGKLQDLAESFSHTPVQRVTNTTGMPDNLKNGIEQLSGYAMDDVKVHYNSAKPAELQAHAYAQGTDIHVAPGQENHLPHEAWHVVQQKQGRVKATTQLKGTAVNADPALETEADVKGTQALTIQRKEKEPVLERSAEGRVAQLVGERIRVLDGDYISDPPAVFQNKPVVVLEMLIPLKDGGFAIAKAKINQLANQSGSKLNVCLSIGLNEESTKVRAAETLAEKAAELITHANTKKVQCAVVPMIATNLGGGGYVFPFIEARVQLGTHEKTKELASRIKEGNSGARKKQPVFFRTIDKDVVDDPLLGAAVPDAEARPALEGRLAARNQRHKAVYDSLTKESNQGKVITGGYNWQYKDLAHGAQKNLIDWLNKVEHFIRTKLIKNHPECVYAPEPNTYIPEDLKASWDAGLQAGVTGKEQEIQMGESTFGRKAAAKSTFAHDSTISTTKPRKEWLNTPHFNGMIEAMEDEDKNKVSIATAFELFKTSVHQSYLNPETAFKIALKHGVALSEVKKGQIRVIVEEGRAKLLEKLQEGLD